MSLSSCQWGSATSTQLLFPLGGGGGLSLLSPELCCAVVVWWLIMSFPVAKLMDGIKTT